MPISSQWDPSFEGLDPGNIDHFRQFLGTLNFKALGHIAAEVRGVDPSSPRVNPKVFQRGSCNVVFDVLFADGVSWAARIRLPTSAWLHPISKPLQLAQNDIAQSEIDVLRYIKSHTSIPVPAIFHYNLSENGDGVGGPYILMEGVDGEITPSVFSSLEPRLQETIYRQLASVVIQLSNLSFPHIGLLRQSVDNTLKQTDWVDDFGYRHSPCQSTLEYYKCVYATFRAEASSSHDRDRQATAWLFERSSQYVRDSHDQNGPFPVCHGDLTSGNFMWDKNFNLVAVIDWTNTMSMPWEMVGVIHEFYNGDSEQIRQARDAFVAILAEEESKLDHKRKVSSLFNSPLNEILTIIKECDIQVPAAMYHVPRLLELLPKSIDVSVLNELSPGFIERAIKHRETIRRGIRSSVE